MKVINYSSSSNEVHLSELHHTEKILRHDVASFPLAMICEFSKLLLTSITSHNTLNISTLKLRQLQFQAVLAFSSSIFETLRNRYFLCVFLAQKKLTQVLRFTRHFYDRKNKSRIIFCHFCCIFSFSLGKLLFRCCSKEEGTFYIFMCGGNVQKLGR